MVCRFFGRSLGNSEGHEIRGQLLLEERWYLGLVPRLDKYLKDGVVYHSIYQLPGLILQMDEADAEAGGGITRAHPPFENLALGK